MPAQAKKLADPRRLCIRIDEKDGYPDLVKTVFEGEDFSSAVAVRHLGKDKRNPHYHIVCEAYYTKETMRYRLNKTFNKGSGNGHMSIKEWDGDKKAIQYLLHECREPSDVQECVKVNVGERYEDHRFAMVAWSELERLRQLSIEIADEIKDNSPGKICGIIAKHIDDNGLNPHDKRLVWNLICKWLMKKGKWMISNKFQAERWMLQVRTEVAKIEDARRGTTKSQDELIEEMYQDYFVRVY